MPLPWLGVFKYINQCHCPGWGYLNIKISATLHWLEVFKCLNHSHCPGCTEIMSWHHVTHRRTQPFIVKDRPVVLSTEILSVHLYIVLYFFVLRWTSSARWCSRYRSWYILFVIFYSLYYLCNPWKGRFIFQPCVFHSLDNDKHFIKTIFISALKQLSRLSLLYVKLSLKGNTNFNNLNILNILILRKIRMKGNE